MDPPFFFDQHSCLSLNNKVLLYKQVLMPILTYAAQIWGLSAKTHRKKVQTLQNKILRMKLRIHRNEVLHNDLRIEAIENHVKNISRIFFSKIADHPNPLINNQLEFAHNIGKYPYPYSSTKWRRPRKPPAGAPPLPWATCLLSSLDLNYLILTRCH
ncbi:hypothetical protein AVEN_124994-1 [Araneus ventricosus]|uniref:RNA-directed DNA polymerase from mobile element jockey n=1 Tax=Araneus ventricosus TaxID=182803 RepID=A0A4Y2EBZ2_ARAVE|nr:hypothetical protein AVEN_124994-1 [Araneus ventricosus]